MNQSEKIQIVTNDGATLELETKDFPVFFYYKDKIYYVKYTAVKDSLYLNTVELDKEQHSDKKNV